MPWLQLKLSASSDTSDAMSDALTEAGAQAVTLLDAADTPIFEPDPDETPLWQHTWVIGMFSAETDMDAVKSLLVDRLGKQAIQNCSINPLEDKDWERAWMDNYQPMPFGQRLWICPSWLTPPQADGVNLMLDPGLAFGTGTHPTTALCLQWLDANMQTGLDVIDYGCGSGILAIAAALLGAHTVRATDHDPQAILSTRQNAEQNHVEQVITCTLPAALDNATADLLLANILAAPLIELAPLFARLVKPGGQLVLSGLLSAQVPQVQAAYTPWFEFTAPQTSEDWVRLDAVRKAKA